MACYKPLTGYQFYKRKSINHNGKSPIQFGLEALMRHLDTQSGPVPESSKELKLPCRKCVGCGLDRAREWAIRCMHEARYYSKSSFITLTYSTPNLPPHKSLRKKDFVDFMKRLKVNLERKHGVTDLRYYMCGEYGDNTHRPHYHAVLFGWDFPDRVEVPNNPWASDPLYDSAFLSETWGLGIVRVGNLTPSSCAYVARYVMKKIFGMEGKSAYEATQRIPPYNGMSKGIGRRYFKDFSGDMFPCDYLVTEDDYRRVPVPEFYDRLYKILDEEGHKAVKAKRQEQAAKLKPEDSTPERLRVREEAVKLRIKQLKRSGTNEATHREHS